MKMSDIGKLITAEDLGEAHDDIMKLWLRQGWTFTNGGFEKSKTEKVFVSLSEQEVITILGTVVRVRRFQNGEHLGEYSVDINWYGHRLWECWENSAWNGRKFDERSGYELEVLYETINYDTRRKVA